MINQGTWGLVDTSGSYLHNEWVGVVHGAGRFVAIATIGSVRVIQAQMVHHGQTTVSMG